MKRVSKLIALLLVFVLVLASMPVAFAQTYSASAGGSVTVTFNVSGVMGKITGISNTGSLISVNDPDGIIASYTQNAPSTGLAGQYGSGSLFYYGTDAANFSQSYTVKLSANAKAGQSATITFTNYEVSDADGNLVTGSAITHTITVKETSSGSGSGDGGNSSGGNEVVVDYTNLQKQIKNVDALNETDYTAASWKTMQSALSTAKSALKSKSQETVDQAASKLAAAIEALVRMDYSALQDALAKVETFHGEEELADLWSQLMDAVANGQAQLTSGDQAAVDAAAQQINGLLEDLKELLEELRTPVIKTEEVEVEVEVPPTYDFCNISIHGVWPVLFFISVALNAALIVLFVMVMARKKNKQKDSVPLVSYDIDDDI